MKIPSLILVLSLSAGLSAQEAPAKSAPRDVAKKIDTLIDAKLKENKVAASPMADDAEWHRRITIDLLGRVPRIERTKEFLSSQDPERRTKLVEELLASVEYGRQMGLLWHHRIVPLNNENHRQFDEPLFRWLAAQFNKDRNWGQIVSDLILAEGEIPFNRNRDEPKDARIGFYMATSDEGYVQPERVAGSVAQNFLGVQLQCAQCHDHPFASWKQTDFWGLTVFFGRVGFDGDVGQLRNKKLPVTLQESTKTVILGGKKGPFVRDDATIVVPETQGKVVKARFLAGEEPTLANDKPFRPALAEWLTSPKNRQFAKAATNRIWHQLFARGLVNPVNDLHEDNEPSHPEILDLLTDEFIASGHDFKHLFRCIAATSAYQRTSRPTAENKDYSEFYPYVQMKLLSPDEIYDSLAVVNDTYRPEKELLPPDQGGVSIRHPLRGQLVPFFTSQEAGENRTRYTLGVSQALKMMNSQMAMGGNSMLLKRASARDWKIDQVIDELVLATYARLPSDEQRVILREFAASTANKGTIPRDMLWILLNSSEFFFNH